MKRPVLALQNVRLGTIALVLALAAFTPAAQGGILQPGSVLNFGGAVVYGSTSSSFQCNQPGDTECVPPPAGSGDFAVAGSTGSFAQYNGTFGLIKSVNSASQPLNTFISLPNWISFDLNNQIALELTFLPLGTDPISVSCAGLTHCTPQNVLLVTPANPVGVTGFNLDQDVTGTTATFFVDGTADAIDSTTASYSGIFTTTFIGLNPQQALLFMLAGNQESYSGQITFAGAAPDPVPEPGTLALFVIALGALGFNQRLKRS
jgi:hypothetical protein